MACGSGSGSGGVSNDSPEALFSSLTKAWSSGDNSICHELFVTSEVFKSAAKCPSEIEQKALFNLEKQRRPLVLECKKDIAAAYNAGVKAKLLSVESMEKKRYKRGDNLSGCTATADITTFEAITKISVKTNGKTVEDTERFDLIKIGQHYYSYIEVSQTFVEKTEIKMGQIHIALVTHATLNNMTFPQSLSEIDGVESADAWGNAFLYESSGPRTYTLSSLGEDGSEGGSGANQDLVMKTGQFVQ